MVTTTFQMLEMARTSPFWFTISPSEGSLSMGTVSDDECRSGGDVLALEMCWVARQLAMAKTIRLEVGLVMMRRVVRKPVLGEGDGSYPESFG